MVVVTRIESRDMAQEKVAFKTSCLNIANKHKRGHFTEGTITYFKYALFIVFILIAYYNLDFYVYLKYIRFIA